MHIMNGKRGQLSAAFGGVAVCLSSTQVTGRLTDSLSGLAYNAGGAGCRPGRQRPQGATEGVLAVAGQQSGEVTGRFARRQAREAQARACDLEITWASPFLGD
jgi:hypothetical protein